MARPSLYFRRCLKQSKRPFHTNRIHLLKPDLQPSSWQASLDIVYGFSGPLLKTMTVNLSSTNPLLSDSGILPEAQLCAMDKNIGCHPGWQTVMVPTPDPAVWTATITAMEDELPKYGIIRVNAPKLGEFIRWFQVSGVGPAHVDGDSPLRDGSVIVDADKLPSILINGEADECNRVIVMPAANYELLQSGTFPDTDPPLQIIGIPLDIDIMMADAEGICRNFAPDEELPVALRYTFFYNSNPSPSATKNTKIYHIEQSNGKNEWVKINTSDSIQQQIYPDGTVTGLSWISTEPIKRSGIFVLVEQP